MPGDGKEIQKSFSPENFPRRSPGFSIRHKNRPEKIFYLAWELSVDPQGRWQWHKGAAFDPAPGDTPVLRASAAALQDPDRLVREIAGKIRSGISGTSLQLDLDVPERQLALYGNLLRQWRREFPEILPISLTILK